MLRALKTVSTALLLAVTLFLFAVPVAADTPRADKPPAAPPAETGSYKGVVTGKDAASFTIKTGETTVKIGVDRATRFYTTVLQDKPASAPTKPAEKPAPPAKITGDTGGKQVAPEAKAAPTKPPETAVRTKTPPAATAPALPGTEAAFSDLKTGDAIAVRTDGGTMPLAKTVVITPQRAPAPVKLSAGGTVVSVDEAKLTFTIKTVSGEVMAFKYDKQTTFSILGSASLRVRMQVEVVYLAVGGVLTARAVKAGETPQRTAAVK